MTEFPPPSLKPIAEEVAALLKSKKQMVAVAETVRLYRQLYLLKKQFLVF